MLLDLSAAFDTVDHQLLLSVFLNRFSVTKSALAWFRSYLGARPFTSMVVYLSAVPVSCGVPQGSVLGPKTFITYAEDIDNIFNNHQVQHHSFADDTQMHFATPRCLVHTIALRLQQCIADVSDWCGTRRLQLNAAKTEIMWFGSSVSLRALSEIDKTVVIGNHSVQTSDSVRNIGVHFDSDLSMHVHIAKTTQICFFQL